LLRPAYGPVATTPLTSCSPSWNASNYVADSPSLHSFRIGLQKGPRHNSGRDISSEDAQPQLPSKRRLAHEQQSERALRIHLRVGPANSTQLPGGTANNFRTIGSCSLFETT